MKAAYGLHRNRCWRLGEWSHVSVQQTTQQWTSAPSIGPMRWLLLRLLRPLLGHLAHQEKSYSGLSFLFLVLTICMFIISANFWYRVPFWDFQKPFLFCPLFLCFLTFFLFPKPQPVCRLPGWLYISSVFGVVKMTALPDFWFRNGWEQEYLACSLNLF